MSRVRTVRNGRPRLLSLATTGCPVEPGPCVSSRPEDRVAWAEGSGRPAVPLPAPAEKGLTRQSWLFQAARRRWRRAFLESGLCCDSGHVDGGPAASPILACAHNLRACTAGPNRGAIQRSLCVQWASCPSSLMLPPPPITLVSLKRLHCRTGQQAAPFHLLPAPVKGLRTPRPPTRGHSGNGGLASAEPTGCKTCAFLKKSFISP